MENPSSIVRKTCSLDDGTLVSSVHVSLSFQLKQCHCIILDIVIYSKPPPPHVYCINHVLPWRIVLQETLGSGIYCIWKSVSNQHHRNGCSIWLVGSWGGDHLMCVYIVELTDHTTIINEGWAAIQSSTWFTGIFTVLEYGHAFSCCFNDLPALAPAFVCI